MSDLQMLPKWLDAAAATLAGAVPPAQTLAESLPGLNRAQSLAPLQRLQRVQESGLAECGPAGEPVHLAWRQFLRGHGPSTLVIDATGFDVRAQGAAAVLDNAPWLLAEGVLIAAGLRDSLKIELRLPPELTGHEVAFLNAVDAIRSLAQVAIPRRQIDVQRNCRPSCWVEGQNPDRSQLVHTPETWCRIAMLFAEELDLDTSLLTLRRGMKQRGLVELLRSGNLRRQIDDWGGGVEVEGQDAVLAFDDGLGGFLPFSKADLLCEPLSFASAGIVPVPSSLMVMAEGVCVVKQTRRALYRHWQLAEGEDASVQGLLARAARLTTEITLGRASPAISSHSTKWRSSLPRKGWQPPGRWAAPCVTIASSGNAMSGVSPALMVSAWCAMRRPATARVRPTSTSPASSPTSVTATIGPPSRSSGATTHCRWSAAWSARRRANPPACAAAATARSSSGR